ncbi:MFS transporter [Lentzea albida]|uniref:MFS transporter n=1 Tax=Lentzea albida TaxID=65499 RepID=UPI0011605FC3|nr:MFS transporter [Lentzea albida]
MIERARVGTLAPVMVALVFLVALNLRPALTSVGPLLPRIGGEAGLSEGAQGLLGALPLLAFAVISPLVQHPARRFGVERTLLAVAVGADRVRGRSGGGGRLGAGTRAAAARRIVGGRPVHGAGPVRAAARRRPRAGWSSAPPRRPP